MQDLRTDSVKASTSRRTDTLAYLAELLGEQQHIATSIGEPFLAFLIGMAAQQAAQRIRGAWITDGARGG